MRVLVLGAEGFLGSYFKSQKVQEISRKLELEFSAVRLSTRSEISGLQISNYEWIINCIANANIESCEAKPFAAEWLNTELPGELALAAQKSNTRVVHFSTDAVFNGKKKSPTEKDEPNPISIYGKSKLAGEKRVLAASELNLVCRVNFVGKSPKGNSLFDYFYKALSSEKTVNGYTNVMFAPLYVEDLVTAVLKMIVDGKKGIYHLTGPSPMSKYDFGVLMAIQMNRNPELVNASRLEQGEINQLRSLDLCLSNQKALNEGIELPSPDQGIRRLLDSLR